MSQTTITVTYIGNYRCPHMTGPGGPLGGCPFCRGLIEVRRVKLAGDPE